MKVERMRTATELKAYFGLSLAMTLVVAAMVVWRPGIEAQSVLLLTPFLILAALARITLKLTRRVEQLESQTSSAEGANSPGDDGGVMREGVRG
ncbi:hypothetical protein GCM10009081_15930 [Brevundimonas nasdae]